MVIHTGFTSRQSPHLVFVNASPYIFQATLWQVGRLLENKADRSSIEMEASNVHNKPEPDDQAGSSGATASKTPKEPAKVFTMLGHFLWLMNLQTDLTLTAIRK